MRLVPTQIACTLAGLSTERLREWTSRRALIPADVAPTRKGQPARFSWRTILVLRLAVVLRERFAVELEHHRSGLSSLRERLDSLSFIALWGQSVTLDAEGTWSLVDQSTGPAGDALLLRLDPHLEVLRDGFELPGAPPSSQLDLFALPAILRDEMSRTRLRPARNAA